MTTDYKSCSKESQGGMPEEESLQASLELMWHVGADCSKYEQLGKARLPMVGSHVRRTRTPP